MIEPRDDYTLTLNAVLNGISAGHISTKADVMYYVGGYNPHMEVGELLNLIAELKSTERFSNSEVLQ